MFDTYSLRLSSPLRSLLFISLVLGLFVACQPSDAPPETAEEVADTVATTEADGPTLDDALQAFRQQDLERTTETKTSSVHFIRVELTDEMITSLKEGAVINAGINHEAYQHEVKPISDNIRQSLIQDLD